MGSGPNCVIGLSESSWPRSSKSPKSEAKGGCIRPCQNASHTSLSVPSAAWTVKGSGSICTTQNVPWMVTPGFTEMG